MIQYTPDQVLQSVSRLLIRLSHTVDDDYLANQTAVAAELIANLAGCVMLTPEVSASQAHEVSALITDIGEHPDGATVAASLATDLAERGSHDALAGALRWTAKHRAADPALEDRARNLASAQLDDALRWLRRAPKDQESPQHKNDFTEYRR